MKKKLAVILVIIGFLAFTSFIAFEKYFGTFKSEIPGKWEVTSGEGCFTQVRFFGGAGQQKTIKLYDITDDRTTTYNGKYETEGNAITAEVMKDDAKTVIDMTYEQTEDKLDLTYTWEGETLECSYLHGAE